VNDVMGRPFSLFLKTEEADGLSWICIPDTLSNEAEKNCCN
jgi:hypothetical protein